MSHMSSRLEDFLDKDADEKIEILKDVENWNNDEIQDSYKQLKKIIGDIFDNEQNIPLLIQLTDTLRKITIHLARELDDIKDYYEMLFPKMSKCLVRFCEIISQGDNIITLIFKIYNYYNELINTLIDYLNDPSTFPEFKEIIKEFITMKKDFIKFVNSYANLQQYFKETTFTKVLRYIGDSYLPHEHDNNQEAYNCASSFVSVLKLIVRDNLGNFTKKTSLLAIVSCFVNLSKFCAEKDKSFSLVDSINILSKSTAWFWENIYSSAKIVSQNKKEIALKKLEYLNQNEMQDENEVEGVFFEEEKILADQMEELMKSVDKSCLILRYFSSLIAERVPSQISKIAEIIFQISCQVFPSPLSQEHEESISIHISGKFWGEVKETAKKVNEFLEPKHQAGFYDHFVVKESSDSLSPIKLLALSIFLSERLGDEIVEKIDPYFHSILFALDQSHHVIFSSNEASFFMWEKIMGAGCSLIIQMNEYKETKKVEKWFFESILAKSNLRFHFVLQLWIFFIQHASTNLRVQHIEAILNVFFSMDLSFPVHPVQDRLLRILRGFLPYLTVPQKEIIWNKFVNPTKEFDFLKGAALFKKIPLPFFHTAHISTYLSKLLPLCLEKIKSFPPQKYNTDSFIQILACIQSVVHLDKQELNNLNLPQYTNLLLEILKNDNSLSDKTVWMIIKTLSSLITFLSKENLSNLIKYSTQTFKKRPKITSAVSVLFPSFSEIYFPPNDPYRTIILKDLNNLLVSMIQFETNFLCKHENLCSVVSFSQTMNFEIEEFSESLGPYHEMFQNLYEKDSYANLLDKVHKNFGKDNSSFVPKNNSNPQKNIAEDSLFQIEKNLNRLISMKENQMFSFDGHKQNLKEIYKKMQVFKEFFN